MTTFDEPGDAWAYIAGVCERDLDLLLLEEVYATPMFGELLATHAGIRCDGGARAVRVQQSVSRLDGESDLEVDFVLHDGSIARLLIENKVDAALQPRQAERYRRAARHYVETESCAVARTLIVAPQAYFGREADTLGFDAALTYEEVLTWYDRLGVGDGRLRYKRSLLVDEHPNSRTAEQATSRSCH